MTDLTQEVANQMFRYDGVNLFWKVKRKAANIGSVAGCLNGHGHATVQLFGKTRYVHRIIWLMVYGESPKYIDHIDGNRANNKLGNLRAATNSENTCNAKAKQNKYGVRNVTVDKNKTWQVKVQKDRTNHCVKGIKTLEEAAVIAEQLRRQLHGEFFYNESAQR